MKQMQPKMSVQLICLYGSVFVYCFALEIYAAIIPNFIQQKVGSPNVKPDTDTIFNDTDTVLESTDVITTRGIIRDALPMFIMLLAGSWRDATGLNKPLMYCALFGEVIAVAIQLLASWKWSINIWISSIAESIIYGIFGGRKLFYIAATCAVADESNDSQRTTRLAFYQVAAFTGFCLSSGLSGYFLHLLGYMWFFVMVISLHLLAIALIILTKEAKNRLKKDEKAKIFQKLKAITKSRPNNLVIWLMVISYIISNVCAAAETNLHLYYLELTFDYTVKEAGLYSAFRLMLNVVSTMVLSPVFTKVLKWSDYRIGILSSLMTLIAAISMVFARTVLELIIFAVLDFLKIFVYTLPMSIVTKCVENDEVGIFISLLYIGGCLAPILFFYIYDCIFSATSKTFPGAFFIASAVIKFLVFLSFWVSSCIYTEPTEILKKNTTSEFVAEAPKSDEITQNNGFIEKAIPVVDLPLPV